MANPLSRTELRAWFRLAGGMKALLNALDRQLRDEAGMTHDDYEILSRLHRAPNRTLRMSELAREVGFSPSRLSHTIGRMEEASWVGRSRSEADRRGTEATLTDHGARVVEAATPAHLALVKRLVFEALGDERAVALAEAMDDVAHASRD
ncbi:MAG: MarR family winged helix-turn-helix transcriptional regulator [Acidimicrobiia bacterium]